MYSYVFSYYELWVNNGVIDKWIDFSKSLAESRFRCVRCYLKLNTTLSYKRQWTLGLRISEWNTTMGGVLQRTIDNAAAYIQDALPLHKLP